MKPQYCVQDSSTEGGDQSELSVRVDRPEKILAAMDTYILFRISTKVGVPASCST